jgi:hypothetical protein
MAIPARVAVVFRETLAQSDNRICALDEFPCIVRRYFFGDIEVNGRSVYFVVRQTPPEWDALLFPVNGARVLFLNEFWFEHTLNDEEELEAFLEKVRCTFGKGRVLFVFEKQKWKDRKKKCGGMPPDPQQNGHQES